jgi:hypothetical protein
MPVSAFIQRIQQAANSHVASSSGLAQANETERLSMTALLNGYIAASYHGWIYLLSRVNE